MTILYLIRLLTLMMNSDAIALAGLRGSVDKGWGLDYNTEQFFCKQSFPTPIQSFLSWPKEVRYEPS